METRIAIWMHGGLGQGIYSQGQPCIHKLIRRLAAHYSIDVYMQIRPDIDFVPEGFSLYSAAPNVKAGLLRWISLFFLFRSNHKKKRYQVLYSFWGYPSGFIVVILAKLFRRPCIVHLQGGDAAYIPSIDYGVFCHPFRRKLCVWAYSRCNVLIALTNYQQKCLNQFVTRQTHVIPYGVDTDVFSYLPARSQSSKIRFLHIGNQTPVKDQETLLRAFALLVQHVSADLTLIGADHMDGRLRELSRELGIGEHISFLGPLRHGELLNYYHTSDILIVTSIYEGQGLVITEAAACGTTIAGTCVGVLADMGEGCGILSPVGDSITLAKKIIEALRLPSQIYERRKAARSWTMERNEDFTVRRIMEEINRLVKDS